MSDSFCDNKKKLHLNKQPDKAVVTNEKSKQRKIKNNKKFEIFLKFFSTLYPDLFSSDNRKVIPLQVGIMTAIGKDLKEKKLYDAYKQYRKCCYQFFSWYTSKNAYLISMLTHRQRTGLNNVKQNITDKHRQYAKEQLKRNYDFLKNKKGKNLQTKKYLNFLSYILKKN